MQNFNNKVNADQIVKSTEFIDNEEVQVETQADNQEVQAETQANNEEVQVETQANNEEVQVETQADNQEVQVKTQANNEVQVDNQEVHAETQANNEEVQVETQANNEVQANQEVQVEIPETSSLIDDIRLQQVNTSNVIRLDVSTNYNPSAAVNNNTSIARNNNTVVAKEVIGLMYSPSFFSEQRAVNSGNQDLMNSIIINQEIIENPITSSSLNLNSILHPGNSGHQSIMNLDTTNNVVNQMAAFNIIQSQQLAPSTIADSQYITINHNDINHYASCEDDYVFIDNVLIEKSSLDEA